MLFLFCFFNSCEALHAGNFLFLSTGQINAWLLPLTLGGQQCLYIKGLTSANLAKWERPPTTKKDGGEPWRRDISAEKNGHRLDVNQPKQMYKCVMLYFLYVAHESVIALSILLPGVCTAAGLTPASHRAE